MLQRVRGLAGANLAVDGKLIDRLVLDVTQQVDTHVYILEVDKTALSQLGVRLQGAFVDPSGVVHYNDPCFPIFENPGDRRHRRSGHSGTDDRRASSAPSSSRRRSTR